MKAAISSQAGIIAIATAGVAIGNEHLLQYWNRTSIAKVESEVTKLKSEVTQMKSRVTGIETKLTVNVDSQATMMYRLMQVAGREQNPLKSFLEDVKRNCKGC